MRSSSRVLRFVTGRLLCGPMRQGRKPRRESARIWPLPLVAHQICAHRARMSQPKALARHMMIAFAIIALPGSVDAQRVELSLDGMWEIDDSVEPDVMPEQFTHRVPVPGLAHLAKPFLKDVDAFDSRELLYRRVVLKRMGLRADGPGELAREGVAGIPRQDRNYLWYRRTFRVPQRKRVAILRIAKAQFGTAVWMNGRKIGEYPGCFTASYFNVTRAIDWERENTLVVRVGAHPGVLPDTYPTGTDFEKLRWTPGIYDHVSLRLCDNPVIKHVQVAPRIDRSEIIVQTRLKNYGSAVEFSLVHRVETWKGGKPVAASEPKSLKLDAGATVTITQRIAIPAPTLWSPETPFLYVVETATGGDSARTRFGMREFHFDPATGKAYLNGKICYLRGSSITLHRFFEDSQSGNSPWNDDWVRQLLDEIPKQLHWNAFRFCIGPVPERWFEIADEAGLLIQNEFFMWNNRPSKDYFRHWDKDELLRQYTDWVRDNWNHASLVIWDTCNETHDPVFGDVIIPTVRKLDLSNRPWENGYNLPVQPGDPVEDHPYLFIRTGTRDDARFDMAELEKMDGRRRRGDQYPAIINEYDWLWLRRDGTPTVATEKLYPKYLGPHATAEDRFALNAYWLGGLTEFWRAHRHHAGVMHYGYLIYDQPFGYTCDHFIDIAKLKLDPHFADFMAEASKPLGVYINFWQPKLPAGAKRQYEVILINDRHRAVGGRLVLTLETMDGEVVARAERAFSLEPVGQQRISLALAVPTGIKGKHLLRATAVPRDDWPEAPTVSRRWVEMLPKVD